MDRVFATFRSAHVNFNGYELAETLVPGRSPEHLESLRAFCRSTNVVNVKKDIRYNVLYDSSTSLRLSTEEANAWVDVYVAYWHAIGDILKAEDADASLKAPWTKVYEAWKEMANALIRGYNSAGFEAWTIPCLYVTGKYLRLFAIRADKETQKFGKFGADFQDDFDPESGKNDQLEDAARVLNRMFQTCITDRAPIEESRKWGLYYIVNLMFKTYFKLNSISLSKNILRAIQAGGADIPPLSAFPKAHQVTFKYYVGVIHFLEENYALAEENLTHAWQMCRRSSTLNKELILTYLIPCHLLTTHTLPSKALLAPYLHLQELFLPLCRCIKSGDLAGFDKALIAGEDEFVRRRIYLTLERGRDIALRNLLRKVFIAGGFEEAKDVAAAPVRRTRVPVAEFGAAISLGSKERMDNDEVECLLANMIYKNLMKGYISRERGTVVLSKGGAFPGTGV